MSGVRPTSHHSNAVAGRLIATVLADALYLTGSLYACWGADQRGSGFEERRARGVTAPAGRARRPSGVLRGL